MKHLCELYDIKLIFSSVNLQESNGAIEWFHATFAEMIGANFAEHPEELSFDEHPYVLYVFTPYELVFGRTSSKPLETLYIQQNQISL